MADKPVLTTAAGNPLADNQNSLTAGPRGLVLMQDYQLIEQLAHQNRERIPERTLHAKGWGAFGTFATTNDITRYTKAKVSSKVGQKTEMLARFSTVAGEMGAADAERDVPAYRSVKRRPADASINGEIPMRVLPFYLLVILTASMTSTAYAAEMYNVTGSADAANKISCSDVIKLPNGSWQANAMFADPQHKVTVNPVFDGPAEIATLDKRCGKQPEPEKH